MKKIYSYAILSLLIMTVATTGCQKDDDSPSVSTLGRKIQTITYTDSENKGGEQHQFEYDSKGKLTGVYRVNRGKTYTEYEYSDISDKSVTVNSDDIEYSLKISDGRLNGYTSRYGTADISYTNDGYLKEYSYYEEDEDDKSVVTFTINDGLVTKIVEDDETTIIEYGKVKNNLNIDILHYICLDIDDCVNAASLLGLTGKRIALLPQKLSSQYKGRTIEEEFSYKFDGDYISEIYSTYGDNDNWYKYVITYE
ncbi:MAG: hypothetical protein PUC50_03485 [Bacteroidales bacterium]|nr:hypothetical protein [Bacteroidales bacterium]